ncbi:MAG: iron ABC transporter permease [Gammaproteobacteria bacterium]|nr:iron ABC transporter permease [Gammaproteobacteria bacterium]
MMNPRTLNLFLFLLLLWVAWYSLGTGSSPVSVSSGLWDWWSASGSNEALIIGEIRLPRTLLALMVGAALGLSGAALQGLLRNPLADPGLVGASQGAALGAALVFYFGFFSALGALATAVAGLLGAVIALLLMLMLAGSGRPALVILAGLAISTLAGAALAVVLNYAPNPYAMQELVFWLLGSVSNRGMDSLTILFPALVIGSVLIWRQRHLLAALSLGEQVAESMGLSVARGSRLTVLGAACLVGAAVSVAGNIGFVGLLVPHIVRPWVGHRPDHLLIPSMLSGAILVCVADIIVRLLPPGQELKLGVLTSLIGAPLFIWLVWKERRQWL